MREPLGATELPRGFRFAATACGLKKGSELDLGLLASDQPATAAAVFTTNLVQAAPVQLSHQHIRQAAGRLRAVLVNAGNANCCTGPEGLETARSAVSGVAYELQCRPEEVLICSTGVVGVPLPINRILKALPRLVRARAALPKHFTQFCRAIMTTDTQPKWASARCRVSAKTVRLLGCAKGAGMIAPSMATMLGFIATDAKISAPLLRRALRKVVAHTFNRITVDGDTSTNDTVAVLANGASGAPAIRRAGTDYKSFLMALQAVCQRLSLAIVADGEGAKRVVDIVVRGASSDPAADRIARTIASSPLVKTACAGADPNWGRILAAAGRAGVQFNPKRAIVSMAGIKVFDGGSPLPFNEHVAHRKLSAPRVSIVVDLQAGKGQTTIRTCDFTADYVKINASYRS